MFWCTCWVLFCSLNIEVYIFENIEVKSKLCSVRVFKYCMDENKENQLLLKVCQYACDCQQAANKLVWPSQMVIKHIQRCLIILNGQKSKYKAVWPFDMINNCIKRKKIFSVWIYFSCTVVHARAPYDFYCVDGAMHGTKFFRCVPVKNFTGYLFILTKYSK